MRKIILLLLPTLFYAQDFTTLLQHAGQNLLIAAKSQEVAAKEAMLKSTESANYPTLDAKLNAIYLKDTPTMHFRLPLPGTPPEFQVGKKPNYTGEIDISYPLFTGFAISSMIDKAQFDLQKAKLEKRDTLRKLYMQIAALYGNAYAIDHAIDANREAVNAVAASLKKAQGFYKAGLLAPSELANIRAKKYEIAATLQTLESQKRQTLQMLSYLTGSGVDRTGMLPALSLPADQTLIDEALSKREDIRALQKALKMDEADIRLARSGRYPTVALIGALKSQGDSLRLNGDGYTNPNKSYIGAAVEWKLFDGFATEHRIEAAKAKRLGRILYLRDYRHRVKTDLQNDLTTLKALQLRKEAKVAQLEAQERYYRLTKGRFANHLAGADELSRAIAARAAAKANVEKIEAEIFIQKCKLLLQSSLERFQRALDMRKESDG